MKYEIIEHHLQAMRELKTYLIEQKERLSIHCPNGEAELVLSQALKFLDHIKGDEK